MGKSENKCKGFTKKDERCNNPATYCHIEDHKNQKKGEPKYKMGGILELIIVVVLIIVGSFLSKLSIDANLSQDLYRFEVSVDEVEKVIFNDYRLDYNFKENTGLLSFEIKKRNVNNSGGDNQKIQQIRVILPDQIVTSNPYYHDPNDGNKKISLIIDETTKDGFVFSEEEQKIDLDRIKIHIPLNGSIFPAGDFIISSVAYRTNGLNHITVQFNTTGYTCTDWCYRPVYNTDIDSFYNVISIKPPVDFYDTAEKNNEQRPLEQRFRLLYQSAEALFKNELYKNFGVSLIAGAIFLGVDIFRRRYLQS